MPNSRNVLVAFAVILSASASSASAQSIQPITSPTPTPFVVGGVKLDIDRLQLVTEAVGRGQEIFTGVATHTETGRLAEPMTLRAPFINQRIEPGAVLHRVELTQRTPHGFRVQSVWCGDVDMKTIVGARGPVICILPNDPLLRAHQMGTSPAWLSTSSSTYGSAPLRADRFVVAPSATDLIGEMAVELEVSRVGRDRVRVRLNARMNGRTVDVMDIERPIVDGVADFPFWTHRLRLTVVGETVRPELTPTGDGSGLAEIGTYGSS